MPTGDFSMTNEQPGMHYFGGLVRDPGHTHEPSAMGIGRSLSEIAQQMTANLGQQNLLGGSPLRMMAANSDAADLAAAVGCVCRALDRGEVNQVFKAQLQMRLSGNPMAAARDYPGGPLVVAESPGHTEERTVADRVEKMCADLRAMRVVPAHVEQLGESVDRAKRDRAALRAMRGTR